MAAMKRAWGVAAAAVLSGTALTGGAAALPVAGWDVRPGVHQVAIEGAPPGVRLHLYDAAGVERGNGVVDLAGSLLLRGVPPGTYTVASERATTAPFDILVPDDVPVASFYAEQQIGPGRGGSPGDQPWYGYIATRDGTTLSAFVSLPGDAADGPYPTLVEYSGYDPSNPDSFGFPQLINALGYAYVGVNMRGSGCSGGSFFYFDEPQRHDGYDVIEAVAAQPWVLGQRVGMTGVSYPGISQLFVAQTQPPSLAAITPFSVIDDSYRAVLYPGGILNTGFGVNWLQQRLAENGFRGQAWAAARIADGDTVCAENQHLRLQNPDLVAMITTADGYVQQLYDPVAPALFVDQIDVPVLLSGAWQDEQTGSHFATMLQSFTGTDHFYATLANGLHTESLGAGSLPRMVEFLELYVAERVPSLGAARVIAPLLAETIFGTGEIELPPDRFEAMTYTEALAAFEAEPPILLNLEEGAADGAPPGTPIPRFSIGLASWPPPQNTATTWYLADGGLAAEPPAAHSGGTRAASYVADPAAVPPTYFVSGGDTNGVWAYDVDYDWVEGAPESFAEFISAPFEAETILTGSGSADLWIRTIPAGTGASDTDLEVTLSEVRPDGTEVMIQSGWLRASHRALDEQASTPLRPVHTHLPGDLAPLVPGEWTPVRVEILPFAHPMRAGSRLRMTVDAPGGNRAEWVFDTIAAGETVEIAFDAERPSSLVLGTIDPASVGADIPDTSPGCTLRGQPCREEPEA